MRLVAELQRRAAGAHEISQRRIDRETGYRWVKGVNDALSQLGSSGS